MVNPLVQSRLKDLADLCGAHKVLRLSLFGSAVSDDFNASQSDLDFLVEFEPLHPRDHADAYFGLLKALQNLFGREVDLVEPEGVRNKYVRASIERSQVPLYAAA